MSKEDGVCGFTMRVYEDDTLTQWQEKGKLPIKLKGRGSLIMVSEEQGGYLAVLDRQYEFEAVIIHTLRSQPDVY